MSGAVLYDLGQLMEITKGNEALLKKILETFTSVVTTAIDEMQSSLQAGNLQGVAMLAHSIKPNIDSLQIKSLYQVVRNIEVDAKAGVSLNLEGDIALLKKVLSLVILQLKENKLVA